MDFQSTTTDERLSVATLQVAAPDSSDTSNPSPRSRRVGMATPPLGFNATLASRNSTSSIITSTSTSTSTSSITSSGNNDFHLRLQTSPGSLSPPPPPFLPPRSPLRPSARSATTSSSSIAETEPLGDTTSNFRVNDISPSRPNTPPPLDLDEFAAIVDAAIPWAYETMRNRTYPSSSFQAVTAAAALASAGSAPILIGSHEQDDSDDDLRPLTSSSKALPQRPPRSDSPISLSLMDSDEDDGAAFDTRVMRRISSGASSFGPLPPALPPPPPPVLPQAPLTKRQHALHELLSSERAYASDLALIREVHLPLALGQPVLLHATSLARRNTGGATMTTSPTTTTTLASSLGPPTSRIGGRGESSRSSSRTLSTASDSSTSSLGPPMTVEDTKIIFSNIVELAIFSDMFCDGLEEALGSNVEGGEGPDRVGELFLQIIPELEKPYKYYITRHPTALTHLQSLKPTPALTAYLAHSQSVAASHSHAWDLSSLLIKPVQRLLKYPLLLGAIIDETPDDNPPHPDKENLKLARMRLEEVARNVNEGRRRAEVVKEVLASKKKIGVGVGVGVAASVNLSKMKLRGVNSSAKGGGGGGGGGNGVGGLNGNEGGNGGNGLVDESLEALEVERMKEELKRIDAFAQQYAKNVVEWAKLMSRVVLNLREWALSFGKVIGLSAEQGSEAFDAFVAVVTDHLMPLCVDLETMVTERLLKEIAILLTTMNQPLKLLSSMSEQEPFHMHLLTMPVSAKNRPPASLLAASQNYLALRGQLAAELPQYLALLHRGLAIFVRRLGEIQSQFWGDVRDRWSELWEMLRVDGEMNAGHEETIGVWHSRWADVDEVMAALNINQAKKLYVDPPPRDPRYYAQQQKHSSYSSAHQQQQQGPVTVGVVSATRMLASLDPGGAIYASGSSPTKKGSAGGVAGALAALEGGTYVSAPQPLTPHKTRSRGVSDASLGGSGRRGGGMRRASNESLQSTWASSPHPVRDRRDSQQRGQLHYYSNQQLQQLHQQQQQQERQQQQQQQQSSSSSKASKKRSMGQSEEFGEYVNVVSISSPKPVVPVMPRTKSMPLPGQSTPEKSSASSSARHSGSSGSSRVQPITPGEGDYASMTGLSMMNDRDSLDIPAALQLQQQRDQQQEDQRGRPSRKPSFRKKLVDTFRTPSNGSRQTTNTNSSNNDRNDSGQNNKHRRSGSASSKSLISPTRSTFFTPDADAPSSPPSVFSSSNNHNNRHSHAQSNSYYQRERDSWVNTHAKYICQVVHACKPPTAVSYFSFPFFTLMEGELYEVLQEAGHPSLHEKLPLYVDDGEDCLLLCRDENGNVGWALASFLTPLSLGMAGD